MERIVVEYGFDLKEQVKERLPKEEIGGEAYSYYSSNIREINIGFREFLLHLSTMESGPEFERSYEELDKMADSLIAGKIPKI